MGAKCNGFPVIDRSALVRAATKASKRRVHEEALERFPLSWKAKIDEDGAQAIKYMPSKDIPADQAAAKHKRPQEEMCKNIYIYIFGHEKVTGNAQTYTRIEEVETGSEKVDPSRTPALASD